MKKLLSLLSLTLIPNIAKADVIDPINEPADSSQYVFFAVILIVGITIAVIYTIIKNKKGK